MNFFPLKNMLFLLKFWIRISLLVQIYFKHARLFHSAYSQMCVIHLNYKPYERGKNRIMLRIHAQVKDRIVSVDTENKIRYITSRTQTQLSQKEQRKIREQLYTFLNR